MSNFPLAYLKIIDNNLKVTRNSLLRLTTGVVTFLVLTLLSISSVSAVTKSKIVVTPKPTPTPTPIESINSFEVFWPLVAGKTANDSWYFLKNLKEKLRGMIIFGVPQKLDYKVLLATKRVLEAEKLSKERKMDLARKTLEKAKVQLDDAETNLVNAKNSGQSLGRVSQVVSNRLVNIEKLTKWLASTNEQLKDILTEVGNKALSISSKL